MEFYQSKYIPAYKMYSNSMDHLTGAIYIARTMAGTFWPDGSGTTTKFSRVCPFTLRQQNNNSDNIVRASFADNDDPSLATFIRENAKVPVFLEKNVIYYLKKVVSNSLGGWVKIYPTFNDAKNNTNQITFTKEQIKNYFLIYFIDYVYRPIEDRSSIISNYWWQWTTVFDQVLPETATLYMPQSQLFFTTGYYGYSKPDTRMLNIGDIETTLTFSQSKMIYYSPELNHYDIPGRIVLQVSVSTPSNNVGGGIFVNVKRNSLNTQTNETSTRRVTIHYGRDANNMYEKYWFNTNEIPYFKTTYLSVFYNQTMAPAFGYYGNDFTYETGILTDGVVPGNLTGPNYLFKTFYIKSVHPDCYLKTANSYGPGSWGQWQPSKYI